MAKDRKSKDSDKHRKQPSFNGKVGKNNVDMISPLSQVDPNILRGQSSTSSNMSKPTGIAPAGGNKPSNKKLVRQ